MLSDTAIRGLLDRYQGNQDAHALSALLQHAETVILGVVRRHAPRHLPMHLDRDDLVAEGRRAAIRCAAGYNAAMDGSFEGYVAVSCRNAILDLLRRSGARKRRGPLDNSAAAQRAASLVPDPGPDPRQSAEHAELRDLLETLPEPGRAILERYYLLGETDLTIGAALHLSESCVRKHRNAALAALRTHYES